MSTKAEILQSIRTEYIEHTVDLRPAPPPPGYKVTCSNSKINDSDYIWLNNKWRSSRDLDLIGTTLSEVWIYVAVPIYPM